MNSQAPSLTVLKWLGSRRCGPLALVAAMLLAGGLPPGLRGASPRQELRVRLTGQALIKQDLRTTVPVAVEQARAYLRGADVVFTNLEGTVAPAGAKVTPRSATTAFGGPEILDCLREMGFNLLSLANNHAWDLQEAGLISTRTEVARRGFGYAGTGGNADEAARAGFIDTPAGRVALVAMASGGVQLTPESRAAPTRAGVNFLELRPDGTLDPAQQERILAAVRSAAREARLVIAYLHNHYWGEPTAADAPPGRERRVGRYRNPAWMENWARQLIDAGAGLFVGHGDPSLHAVELHRGRPILYGLGNYIFHTGNFLDRYGPLAFFGAVAEVRFTGDRLSGLTFTPLVLGLDGAAKGAPFLAQEGEASVVLAGIAAASAPYGTRFRVTAEKAELVIP